MNVVGAAYCGQLIYNRNNFVHTSLILFQHHGSLGSAKNVTDPTGGKNNADRNKQGSENNNRTFHAATLFPA